MLKRYNIPGPAPKVFFGSYKEFAQFSEVSVVVKKIMYVSWKRGSYATVAADSKGTVVLHRMASLHGQSTVYLSYNEFPD